MTSPNSIEELARELAEDIGAEAADAVPFLIRVITEHGESMRRQENELVALKLDALAEELFNACVDNPDMQMTWNSALRQSAYKVQALAKSLRTRLTQSRER